MREGARMLEDVFVRFEVEDGDVVGYIFLEDPRDGADTVACLWIVPPYLALSSVGTFMEKMSETLHSTAERCDDRTFYIP